MTYQERILDMIRKRDPEQKEFFQAVQEVLESTRVCFDAHPEWEKEAVLERLVEPEKTVECKVSWQDDQENTHVNRAYRVQFNAALGPYKGGFRFHPSVNLGIMKFLGFEQIFKNALTTLPIGGAKGGSDFDPKGKSDAEIRRFCQAFMSAMYTELGPDKDVPAGDMGVGEREIGYLYGAYRHLKQNAERGVLTGKSVSYGGSLGRREATGYGLVYFTEEVLKREGLSLEGKRVIVSGSGNVAIYAAEKAMEKGAKVIAMSDSCGYVKDEDLDLEEIKHIKEKERGSLSSYSGGEYREGSVYDDTSLKADIVLPCATQNEINRERAENIRNMGVFLVAEGANMPSDNEAVAFYKNNGIIYVPGKASNAGGVAVSALEMAQNSARLSWSFEEVDEKLQGIMKSIFRQCVDVIEEYRLPKNDYQAGANIAGMLRVVSAMRAQGDY